MDDNGTNSGNENSKPAMIHWKKSSFIIIAILIFLVGFFIGWEGRENYFEYQLTHMFDKR
jgi:hypothetical protein